MAIRDDILSLLRSHTVSRIRFRFPIGVHLGNDVAVTSASFRRVEAAIESGAVAIKETTRFPPGIAGMYINNTLRVDPRPGRARHGMILHECTHAYFDIAQKRIRDHSDEAAAYTVNALYYRMTGYARGAPLAQLHEAARPVADALLQEYQDGAVGAPRVDLAAWHALRLSIRAHPTYHGIRGRWLDDSRTYEHDG